MFKCFTLVIIAVPNKGFLYKDAQCGTKLSISEDDKDVPRFATGGNEGEQKCFSPLFGLYPTT